MILIIDTIDKICKVAIHNGRDFKTKEWSWDQDTGTEVLKNLKELLNHNKKTLKDIEAIAVNQGPGSYTGTRVGITIANALGWSLKIPVFGYSNDGAKEAARKIFQKNKSKKIPHHFPAPIYK